MSEADASRFANDVVTRLPELALDYVRLNIRARLR